MRACPTRSHEVQPRVTASDRSYAHLTINNQRLLNLMDPLQSPRHQVQMSLLLGIGVAPRTRHRKIFFHGYELLLFISPKFFLLSNRAENLVSIDHLPILNRQETFITPENTKQPHDRRIRPRNHTTGTPRAAPPLQEDRRTAHPHGGPIPRNQ